MDEIIHFTSDLKHEAYAFKEFERKTIEHLKAKNIMIKCIYEFLDNCLSQYKSKIPFRILSKSGIPIMRNYFCTKHGKSTADGLIGRTSQFLYTAVVTKNADYQMQRGCMISAKVTGKKSHSLVHANTMKEMFSDKRNKKAKRYNYKHLTRYKTNT